MSIEFGTGDTAEIGCLRIIDLVRHDYLDNCENSPVVEYGDIGYPTARKPMLDCNDRRIRVEGGRPLGVASMAAASTMDGDSWSGPLNSGTKDSSDEMLRSCMQHRLGETVALDFVGEVPADGLVIPSTKDQVAPARGAHQAEHSVRRFWGDEGSVWRERDWDPELRHPHLRRPSVRDRPALLASNIGPARVSKDAARVGQDRMSTSVPQAAGGRRWTSGPIGLFHLGHRSRQLSEGRHRPRRATSVSRNGLRSRSIRWNDVIAFAAEAWPGSRPVVRWIFK